MCSDNIWESEGFIWDPKTHGLFYRTLWKIQTCMPAIKVIRIYIDNVIFES